MPEKHTIAPRACEKCGTLFQPPFASLKAGYGRFCSHRCASSRPHTPPSVPELLSDGTARVPVYGRGGVTRAFALIDAADAAYVGQYRWSLSSGYARRYETIAYRKRIAIPLHRDILGLTYGDGVDGDHINRDRLDCRRENLRPGTKGQNAQNKSAQKGRASSVYRGVRFRPKAKVKQWQATITVNGKRSSLGYFKDEHEAGAIAKAARLRLMPYAVD